MPEVLVAEHGLSVLVTVTKQGRQHRLLYDTGFSPDGMAENMRRLAIDPADIEAIVCSHGHLDHTRCGSRSRTCRPAPTRAAPSLWP